MKNQKKNTGKYYKIPEIVLLDDNLKCAEKIIFSIILSYGEKGCFASREYFAQRTGYSKGGVDKFLRKLKENGYISSKDHYKGYKQRIVVRKPRFYKINELQGLNTELLDNSITGCYTIVKQDLLYIRSTINNKDYLNNILNKSISIRENLEIFTTWDNLRENKKMVKVDNHRLDYYKKLVNCGLNENQAYEIASNDFDFEYDERTLHEKLYSGKVNPSYFYASFKNCRDDIESQDTPEDPEHQYELNEE